MGLEELDMYVRRSLEGSWLLGWIKKTTPFEMCIDSSSFLRRSLKRSNKLKVLAYMGSSFQLQYLKMFGRLDRAARLGCDAYKIAIGETHKLIKK